jgi:hypothetical protein
MMHKDLPMDKLPVDGFLNCYELDELRQELDTYHSWFKDEFSDDTYYLDSLLNVL